MFAVTRNGACCPTTSRSSLDRFFEEFARDLGGVGFAPRADGYVPPLDVTETPKDWRIRADLPGVDPKDVHVTLEDGVLTIRGERKAQELDEGEEHRRLERRSGAFERSLRLPAEADAAGVTARAKNGVLTVTVPKAEKAQPKAIDIQAE